jgi:hypothetical protein
VTYRLLSQFDAFSAFTGEQERTLARAIAQHTGIIPQVVTALSADEEAFPALRFWMRNSDKKIIERDLDLRQYKNGRENVKHALRDAVRTSRLDHVGGPIDELPEEPAEPEPSTINAIIGGYEQALDDAGIDKAGDFNPEGWYERSLARARGFGKRPC